MLKIGQNSSSLIHTSIILQNCGQSLSILSFCCISLHFEANWTMLKIEQNSSSVICTSIILQKCGQSLSVPLFHCILLHFEANQTILKIWSEFIFGLLQNCGQQLSIPSFRLCWKFGLEYIPQEPACVILTLLEILIHWWYFAMKLKECLPILLIMVPEECLLKLPMLYCTWRR